MRAGELRHRIKLQVPASGDDSFGEPLTGWVNVFATPDGKIAAGVEPLAGRELVAAQAIQVEVSHKITVRYQPALASPKLVATMRALYGTRVFSIGGALNIDERNREITLLATEGVNNG
jgi:SPP1 family predicted phage head-tail adaptor